MSVTSPAGTGVVLEVGLGTRTASSRWSQPQSPLPARSPPGCLEDRTWSPGVPGPRGAGQRPSPGQTCRRPSCLLPMVMWPPGQCPGPCRGSQGLPCPPASPGQNPAPTDSVQSPLTHSRCAQGRCPGPFCVPSEGRAPTSQGRTRDWGHARCGGRGVRARGSSGTGQLKRASADHLPQCLLLQPPWAVRPSLGLALEQGPLSPLPRPCRPSSSPAAQPSSAVPRCPPPARPCPAGRARALLAPWSSPPVDLSSSQWDKCVPGPRGIREGLCPLEALSQHLALTWSDPLTSLASVPSPRKGE